MGRCATAGKSCTGCADFTGCVTTVAGSDVQGQADGPWGSASLHSPYGIEASADGATLFITDKKVGAIRTLDLASRQLGTLTPRESDGGAGAPFGKPTMLARSSDGSTLYVSDNEREEIRVIRAGSPPSTPFWEPARGAWRCAAELEGADLKALTCMC